ncbi:MAG: hypothetical protein HQK63_08750 [Desulfamplus sp.]|nr:hypothetical protein [Desulfamplus sp.]
MLNIPETYLNSIVSNNGNEKDLSKIILNFIINSKHNIHFVIDEKKLNLPQIITEICLKNKNNVNKDFDFNIGQKVTELNKPLNNQRHIYSIEALSSEFPNFILRAKDNKLTNGHINLNIYIPVSDSNIQSLGIIEKRIKDYKKLFQTDKQSDFINNDKLLVIGNLKLFKSIPKEYPSCFVSKLKSGAINIEYNSPIIPKICILKSIDIDLLNRYLEKEINGKYISFNRCIFVGNTKFENNINMIRKCYNQKLFEKIILIGKYKKDLKIDLGNNQKILRWKWTIPEINYFENRKHIEHDFITIQNEKLDKALSEFHNTIKEIETEYTISLRKVWGFIRKLYYDWDFQQESNQTKLQEIYSDFQNEIKELLQEEFFNIDDELDYQVHYNNLVDIFNKIIDSIKSTNNKTETLIKYINKVDELVVPSYRCSATEDELKQFLNKRGNNSKPAVISLSKSDNNKKGCKLISSIYGNGNIQRLIEKLSLSNTKYTVLAYEIEKKILTFNVDRYVEELNKEYSSKDRYEISGISFSDNFYNYTNYDELITALTSNHQDERAISFIDTKIIFDDKSSIKIASSRAVLKINDDEKEIIKVDELDIGDTVQIYNNPDKDTLKIIFELKYPDLVSKAKEYSELWQNCLIEYHSKNKFTEQDLYNELSQNGFSLKNISSLRRYLRKELMFPAKKKNLIAIAKTLDDKRLDNALLRTQILPIMKEYSGKNIKEGFKFSEGINHFLITGEINEYLSGCYSQEELEKIASQIPIKKIKDIQQLELENKEDD